MKPHLTVHKYFLYIVFVVFCYSCKSTQKNNLREDALSAQVDSLLSHNQWTESIALSEDYIRRSYENHDKRNVVLGYIKMAHICVMHSDYKQALLFFNKANTEKKQLDDPELNARLYIGYAYTYNFLNLNDQSLQFYDKAYQFAEKIPNLQKRQYTLWSVYINKALCWKSTKQFDSMIACMRNAFIIRPEPDACSRIAQYFIVNKVNLDSAQFYLHEADSLYDKNRYPLYYKGLIQEYYGDLYTAKVAYDTAISAYSNAENIFMQVHRFPDLGNTYNALSRVYNEKGIANKGYEYQGKYIALSDSLKNAENDVLNISVKNIEDEYIQQSVKDWQKILRFIMGLLFFLALIGVFIFRHIKSIKIKERKTNALLSEKEEETLALQHKINDTSFNELIDLAKQNHPNFYTRFSEIYPAWHKKIIEMAPDITPTELTLCAYIYLDFQTKEIAALTYRSIRTIQLGKNSLRKKLKIASDVNLNLWLKNVNCRELV